MTEYRNTKHNIFAQYYEFLGEGLIRPFIEEVQEDTLTEIFDFRKCGSHRR